MQTGYATRHFASSALLGLLVAAQFVVPAHAAVVDIATVPLYNKSSVKPNLLFLLDDSSSMDYNYLPDEVPRGGNPTDTTAPANPILQGNTPDTHVVALTSPQCNGVAYNPAIAYSLPVDSSGNPMPQPSFTSAPDDGYKSGSSTTDLTGQTYYVYKLTPSNSAFQKALSYSYCQATDPDPNCIPGIVKTWTPFYQQCNELVDNSGNPTDFTKTTVGAGEQQNYANWYSYYRTRMLMMKTLAGQTFNGLNSDFRVGFSTIHDKGSKNAASFLAIDDFVSGTDGQQDKFYKILYGTGATANPNPQQQYTPLRGALSTAGQMYAGKLDGADPVQYSCQQNFTLLATDGYWNSSDELTSYGPFKIDNSPVGDQDGGASGAMYDAFARPNTLADVAMYYYQTDLRSVAGKCTSPSTGANLCPSFRNVPPIGDDNNTSLHMTTFTLGLAINGLVGYSPTYPTDKSGDFFSIKTGSKKWPDPKTATTATPLFYDGTIRKQVIERVDDIWHAAVNGRGTYFNVNDPASLALGMKGALAAVGTVLGYGNAGATSSLVPITGDNALYVATYTTGQWTGNLLAQSIDPNTGSVINAPAWCAEDLAADVVNGIPVPCTGTLASKVGSTTDTRKIYYNNAGTLNQFSCANDDCSGTNDLPASVRPYFDNSQLTQWTSTFTGTHKKLINFLRGQTSDMSTSIQTKLYRQRLATLGDVVDTQPVFVGKPRNAFLDTGYNTFKSDQAGRAKTVFVAANDGMLHAFDAVNGNERWAFVPSPVMPNMHWLADLNYANNHHYYVNGRISYSDVWDAAHSKWRTILMGGLNGGGRGYYALDVTDPANPSFLWEFTSKDDVDITKNDKNLGYSFGNPLAVKKRDGTWVVVVSSGYDNVKMNKNDPPNDPYDTAGDGKGYLFVLDPITGAKLNRISTGAGTTDDPSGLGRMSYWADDPEHDATARYVYGGDLKGNLWRFNINCTDFDCTAVTCDAGDGTCAANKPVVKLATFTDAASGGGNLQPITTRPEMTLVGDKRMIFAATGKYLEVKDLDPTKFKTQSLYAMVDTGATLADPRSLAKRTLVDASPTRTLTKDNVDPAAGWFVDFPDSGERSSVDMVLAQGTLLVPTNVPTNDPTCNAGGFSWLNFFDYKTGGLVGGSNYAAVFLGNDLTTGLNVVWSNGVPEVIRTGNASRPKVVSGVPFAAGSAGVKGHRVGWREIVKKEK